ncbi:MAG: MerR family DNA-binding protein [Gemmatimonadetes bacterium]|nr:MerR family DNA-binding protein [Gemmatimonadota bacterium]MCH8145671.1 MerR family DNA-binding protein [Gemmatimonadota bacterium]MCH8938789.1 MerR family DNA-binding protein [Gemmatimonadota bacterium]
MTRPTIGQVAKRAGVGVETVRFYERRGLIEQPIKRNAGYRVYPEDVVHRIRFIRHAKDLGFTLNEIGELLSLRPDPHGSCDAVKERAEAKVADIEEKIGSLTRMQHSLGRLIDACESRSETAECPILEALE